MTNERRHDLGNLEYEFATQPKSEAFIPLAESYLNIGRYVEAMVVCKKGINAHPEISIGRLIMARIYVAMGKNQKAIEELENLLKSKPQEITALVQLGTILLKQGQEEKGIETLKKALDLDPKNQKAFEILLKLGTDYLPATKRAARTTRDDVPAEIECSEPSESAPAARATRAAPQREPEPPRAAPAEAQFHAPEPAPNKKRIADIILEREKSQRSPRKIGINTIMFVDALLVFVPIIYFIFSWQKGLTDQGISMHLKDARVAFDEDTFSGYQKALDSYRAVYKLDPKHAEAVPKAAFAIGVLVNDYGRPKEMLTEANKYLQAAGNTGLPSPYIPAARSLVQIASGRSLAEVIKSLQDEAKKAPDMPIIQTALGSALLKKGDLSQARDPLLKGASQGSPRALTAFAEYAIQRSMYREADKALRSAIQAAPHHGMAHLTKSILYLIWGNTDKFTLEAAVGLNLFRAELEVNASDKEKMLADLVEAAINTRNTQTRSDGVAALEALAKKDAGNALVHYVAAREFRRADQLDKAKKFISIAIRLDPTRPDFMLEEAVVYLEMKDYEAARSRALLIEQMEEGSGLGLMVIGDAYLGERNYDKAIQYFREAAKNEYVESLAHMKLGQTYLKKPTPDEDSAQAALEVAIPGLAISGEGRKAARAGVILARIYEKKNQPTEYIGALSRATQADPFYAPPFCMIVSKIALDTPEGKDQAMDYCDKCVKLDSRGDHSKGCKDLLAKLK